MNRFFLFRGLRSAPSRPSFLLPGLLGLLALAATSHAVEFPAHRGGGFDFPGGAYADTSFEGVTYVPAEFLSDLVGGTPGWDPDAQQLRIRDSRRREWILTLDSPFLSAQGEVYNLTYPVRRGPERIYLPLQPLLRLLRVQFGAAIEPVGAPPAGAAGTRAPAAARAHLSTMTIQEIPGATVVRIPALPGVRWEGRKEDARYVLRARGAGLASGFPRRLAGKGLLELVEAAERDGDAELTLRLRGARDSVELVADGQGVLVTVRPAGEPPVAVGTGTIILDAGHGGKDPGAIVKGVRETDVNLAVALQLRRELRDMGYRVLMTRETDVFKTLEERPRFASEQNGDLFVSLHSNSIAGPPSRMQQVTGYVAYILREAQSEEDKAIERRENKAIELSGNKGRREISPLDWILLEHQLNLYSKQSEALAESIVRNFEGFEIPRWTTGARQAGFFVLVGAYMPAVLFEMGFLTHDRDRRVLSSPSGQREIARRMALAIDEFQKQRKSGG